VLSTPQKTPADPQAVEQLVQDELRYREQRAATAALLAALPPLPAPPTGPANAAGAQGNEDEADEDEEGGQPGRLSMTSVQQWLHTHAPRDRRAALPVTRACVSAGLLPPALAPARLLAALRSPARPLSTLALLRTCAPEPDPPATARLLLALLAFAPEPAVSRGALATACALLSPGLPRFSSATSVHAFLLQCAACSPVRLAEESAPFLLAAFDWQRYLAAHGAHLEPADTLASPDAANASTPSTPSTPSGFLQTANIGALLSLVGVAALARYKGTAPFQPFAHSHKAPVSGPVCRLWCGFYVASLWTTLWPAHPWSRLLRLCCGYW
jgi:hypothetical protein